MRTSCLCALIAGASVLAGSLLAQDPAPAPAPAAATAPAPPPAPSAFTHFGTDFSFLFDGYVDKNFNNPPSGMNQLQNFDFRANMAHVNMGKITIDHGPAPIGFHLDVGFGDRKSVV